MVVSASAPDAIRLPDELPFVGPGTTITASGDRQTQTRSVAGQARSWPDLQDGVFSALWMHAALLASVLATTPSCDGAGPSPTLPTPSPERFRAEVYPVLLRDCAFHACHGDAVRPFQVFGAGRARLQEEDGPILFPLDPSTDLEIETSYERARSMLLHRGDLEMSALLRKIQPGGAHEGLDDWGLNVYASVQELGYRTILAWASGEELEVETDSSDSESESGQ